MALHLVLSGADLRAQTPDAGDRPGASRLDPVDAASFGLVPGLGQFMLGNYAAGATQSALFLTFLGASGAFAAHPDYIPSNERFVDFDLNETLLARELDKAGELYRDLPFLTESRYEREVRLYRAGKIAELNALFKYGPYARFNTPTANSDLAFQSALHTFFYSSYSAYRDAGGTDPSIQGETWFDLAISPFQPEFIFTTDFMAPILLLAFIQARSSQSGGTKTLVPPGFKKSGALAAHQTVVSFNAAVGEEAFFRGYLNHSLGKDPDLGPNGAAAISSILFGLAHYDPSNPLGSVAFPTLAGFYFAWMHNKNDYDIRPAIALHFWWDILVLFHAMRDYKEDRNVGKTPRQVRFMPTLFQLSF